MQTGKANVWISLVWCFGWLPVDFCLGEFCPLATTTCSMPGAPCSIVRDKDCSRAAELDEAVERYPGPVTSLTVSTMHLPPVSPPQSRSNVQVKWNLPEHGTHVYLTGFEVRFRINSSSSPYCFVYKLSHPTWNFDSTIRQYVLNCTSLREGHYDIEVTSLPRSKFSRLKATAILDVKHKLTDDPKGCESFNSCRMSDLVIYNRPCNHSLSVSFNALPKSEGIVMYTVSLFKRDSLLPETSKTVPTKDYSHQELITFQGPSPGDNRIIKLIPGGSICSFNKCVITRSEPFNIANVDNDDDCTFIQSNLSKPGNIKTTPIIIIISVITAAFIITVIVVLLARTMKRREAAVNLMPEGNTVGEDNNTSSQVNLVPNIQIERIEDKPTKVSKRIPQKLVYLMYANDNKYHQNAVGCLKEFLTRFCYCDVIYDMEYQDSIPDNKMPWIYGMLKKCDYIMLLNSAGTYRRATAFQGGFYFPHNTCDSCLGDMFTPAFSILCSRDGQPFQARLVLAHFAYTSPEYRSPPLPGVMFKKNYQLMTDIEQLYASIHGLTAGGSCPSDVNEMYYDRTEEGSRLAQALRYATEYMERNPTWYDDIHGKPRSFRLESPLSNGQLYQSISCSTTNEDMPSSRMQTGLTGCPSTANLSEIDVPSFIQPDDTFSFNSSAISELVANMNGNEFEPSNI